MLHNAGGFKFPRKSVIKMYGSNVVSVARGWVGVKYPENEWPPVGITIVGYISKRNDKSRK